MSLHQKPPFSHFTRVFTRIEHQRIPFGSLAMALGSDGLRLVGASGTLVCWRLMSPV